MPELPEVETIVRQLNKDLKGEVINDLWTDNPNNLKGNFKIEKVRSLIKKRKILKIVRKGKNILIFLDQDLILWIHLKLTGHLLVGFYEHEDNHWRPKAKGALSDPQNRFLHWVFSLKNGKKLVLSDMRKFAKIVLLTKEDFRKEKDLNDLGIDPLSLKFNQKILEETLSKPKGEIKKVLMEQKFISGIGNIYANEILWDAKINPFKKAKELKKKEIKRLFQSITKILDLAIKYQGTSAEDGSYRNLYGEKGFYAKFLKVYQKEGDPCSRCGTLIKRIKDQSRSTFYCSKCQK
ncbi:MAG: bifunctional DNA-formamidopyrimidine glycosylase/DNA-(apurinic or apyrimidinic site) lyase [Candidatus Paceibacterota bacterium]|jgi:formamidopyrimidine-DNA glycosylase